MPFSVAGFEATGPMRAMPLISAGMGFAALLAATLFMWAFLAALVSGNEVDAAEGRRKICLRQCRNGLFHALSRFHRQRDSAMLLASTVYLAALILSWSATRVEAPVANF